MQPSAGSADAGTSPTQSFRQWATEKSASADAGTGAALCAAANRCASSAPPVAVVPHSQRCVTFSRTASMMTLILWLYSQSCSVWPSTEQAVMGISAAYEASLWAVRDSITAHSDALAAHSAPQSVPNKRTRTVVERVIMIAGSSCTVSTHGLQNAEQNYAAASITPTLQPWCQSLIQHQLLHA